MPTTNMMGNLIFHFSFMFFVICPCISHSNLTDSDKSALFVFKSSVRDPYNHLENWSNSSSICNWSGITCDSKQERVRILSLEMMGLQGTLPKELLQLQRLEILNLSYNGFTREIPSWIGSFFTLQHLVLGNNSFQGFIPPTISNLSKLETLDLNSNSLQGSIPFNIGRLQNLKILRLSVNKLSGIIPPTISNLSSLEWFSSSNNDLQGHIPIDMNKLTKLKIMYLGGNKLTGQIPRSIGSLIRLQELYLNHNNLQGDASVIERRDYLGGWEETIRIHVSINRGSCGTLNEVVENGGHSEGLLGFTDEMGCDKAIAASQRSDGEER